MYPLAHKPRWNQHWVLLAQDNHGQGTAGSLPEVLDCPFLTQVGPSWDGILGSPGEPSVQEWTNHTWWDAEHPSCIMSVSLRQHSFPTTVVSLTLHGQANLGEGSPCLDAAGAPALPWSPASSRALHLPGPGSHLADPQHEYVRTVEVSSLGDPEAPTGKEPKSKAITDCSN